MESFKVVLLVVHVIILVTLIISVLMQPSEGGGLTGGGGMNNFLAGRAATSLMGKITSWLGAAFILSSITLVYIESSINKKAEQEVLTPIEVQEETNAADDGLSLSPAGTSSNDENSNGDSELNPAERN